MTAPRQMTMLFGEEFDLPPGGPVGSSTGAPDPMPPGPYVLGMLYQFGPEGAGPGAGGYHPPFSVVGADGKTVGGHIPSLAIAKAARDALNAAYPS